MTWLSDVIDHQRAAEARTHLHDVLADEAQHGRPGAPADVLPASRLPASAGPAPTGGATSTHSLPAGLPRLPGSAGPDRVPPRAPVRAGSTFSP